MSKRWQYAINGLLLGFIAALAYDAAGQTLQPVDTGGGFSLWIVLVLGVVIVLIAGLIIWHKRNPSGQAVAMTEAHANLAAALGNVHDFLASTVHKDKPSTTIVGVAGPEIVSTEVIWSATGIDPGELAAVEAARVAYENAKADAGIP